MSDRAGNTVVYKYYQEFVVDATKPYVTGIEVISSNQTGNVTSGAFDSYNQTTDNFDYYNEGDKIIFIVYHSEGISGTLTSSTGIYWSMGGDIYDSHGSYTYIIIGTTIVFTYTVKPYDNPRSLSPIASEYGLLMISYAAKGLEDKLGNTISDDDGIVLEQDDYPVDETEFDVGEQMYVSSECLVNYKQSVYNAKVNGVLDSLYGYLVYVDTVYPYVIDLEMLFSCLVGAFIGFLSVSMCNLSVNILKSFTMDFIASIYALL